MHEDIIKICSHMFGESPWCSRTLGALFVGSCKAAHLGGVPSPCVELAHYKGWAWSGILLFFLRVQDFKKKFILISVPSWADQP